MIKMEDIVRVDRCSNYFKISWKMTNWCNYRCSYCYMSNSVSETLTNTSLGHLLKISSEIDNITVDAEYINKVDMVLNGESSNVSVSHLDTIEFKELKPREQELLNDIIFLIKERFTDGNNDAYATYKYLLHFIQGL